MLPCALTVAMSLSVMAVATNVSIAEAQKVVLKDADIKFEVPWRPH
jgi:hypothetical protein